VSQLAESSGTYPNRDRANLPIDDYAGRYAECYAIYADQQAALLEDLKSGKISGSEFDELWEEVRLEFEVCRELTDSDHDMFEEMSTLGLPF
jgi:hypothetical protein